MRNQFTEGNARREYDFSWMNKSSYLLNHHAMNCLLYRINKTSIYMAFVCGGGGGIKKVRELKIHSGLFLNEEVMQHIEYNKNSHILNITRIFLQIIVFNSKTWVYSSYSCLRSRLYWGCWGEGGGTTVVNVSRLWLPLSKLYTHRILCPIHYSNRVSLTPYGI
jgi:hypothetical protein